MPAAAAPPLAAPPGVTIIPPSTPARPLPPPSGEIRLTAPARETIPPHGQPRPGSAREKLSQSLYKKAADTAPVREPATPPAPDSTPSPEPPDPNAVPTQEPEETPSTPPVPPETPTPEAGEKKKANPWKLMEQWKTRAQELEKQIADKGTTPLAEQEKKQFSTQLEQLQQRNKVLEDEMRFVNYEASGEFKEQFDKPYQKAWQNFVQELGELTVQDPETQAQRQVTTQDMMALCNLPLAEARKMANQLYGDFADDMMAHRKEIKGLFQNRAEALAQAKANGSERVKQAQEMFQKRTQEVKDFISSTWNKVNGEAVKHEVYGKFFQPIEGDQDGNQRLAKGFALVDRAFNENPEDPRHSPEERSAIVKRHAIVRNRAAATGRLIAWLNQRDAKIADLEKKLSAYQGSTPTTGGSPAASGGAPNGAHTSATSSVMGALRKLAH